MVVYGSKEYIFTGDRNEDNVNWIRVNDVAYPSETDPTVSGADSPTHTGDWTRGTTATYNSTKYVLLRSENVASNWIVLPDTSVGTFDKDPTLYADATISTYTKPFVRGDFAACSTTNFDYVFAENWELLGDQSAYALKSTTITGTGDLTGGGDLSTNRTIDLSSAAKTLLNGAVQDVIANTVDHTSYFLSTSKNSSTKEVTISAKVYSGGPVSLSFNQTNGLVANINSGYVEGTLTDTNKLLTMSGACSYYGKLSGGNTWSGAQSFSSDSFSISSPTDSNANVFAFSRLNPPTGTNGALNIGSNNGTVKYRVNIQGDVVSDLISCSSAPTIGNHLTNKTYVDGMLTWGTI